MQRWRLPDIKEIESLVVEDAVGFTVPFNSVQFTPRVDGSGQCYAKGGGADQRPSANPWRSHEPQFGSFPTNPKTSGGNGSSSTPDDSVMQALSKR